jgi:ferredoxin
LADLFPLYTNAPHDLKPSSQASRLLEQLEPLGSQLKNHGIHHGFSRLMVGPNLSNKQPCVYCGECIYGCPYGCIYNSANDLASLLQHPRLQYQSNTVVTTVHEEGDIVTVNGFDRLSKERVSL